MQQNLKEYKWLNFRRLEFVVLGLLQNDISTNFYSKFILCLMMVKMAQHSHSFDHMPFYFPLQTSAMFMLHSLFYIKVQN